MVKHVGRSVLLLVLPLAILSCGGESPKDQLCEVTVDRIVEECDLTDAEDQAYVDAMMASLGVDVDAATFTEKDMVDACKAEAPYDWLTDKQLEVYNTAISQSIDCQSLAIIVDSAIDV